MYALRVRESDSQRGQARTAVGIITGNLNACAAQTIKDEANVTFRPVDNYYKLRLSVFASVCSGCLKVCSLRFSCVGLF